MLVLANDYNEQSLCQLLALGAVGYLAGDASPELLHRAIAAVARGEIWAPRHLVARVLRRALTASGAEAIITSRERDILGLLRMGHTNRQIAEALSISRDTVKWHFRKIFHKIGVTDRLQAALYAREHNISAGQDRSQEPAVPRRRSSRAVCRV